MDTLGDPSSAAGVKLPSPRRALWFGVRFACVLAVLLAPWPGLGDAYGAGFTKLGNALLSPFEFSRAHFAFGVPEPGEPTEFSSVLRARDTATGRRLQVPIELRTLTFIPTMTFIALVLAGSLARGLRRTGIQLLAGLAVLQIFLVFSLLVPLCLFFSEPRPMQLITLSSPVYDALTIFHRALVAPPGMAYAVPLLWWLVLSALERPEASLQPQAAE